MTIDINAASDALAAAILANSADGMPGSDFFFGTVTASTSTTVTVQPDGSSISLGPLLLIGTKTVAVSKRAVCIITRDGFVGCIGEVFAG